MLRTKNLTFSNGNAVELSIDDVIDTKNSLIVQNTSATGYVYIGGSNVTTSVYGYKLSPLQSFSIDLEANDTIYACGDTGTTASVLILEKSA